MAISISTFHPLATVMIGEKSNPDKRGRDLSLFNAAGTLGLAIMSLIFGWLADQFDLVYAYRLASIPFLISFLLYIVLYFRAEKQLPIKINTTPIQ